MKNPSLIVLLAALLGGCASTLGLFSAVATDQTMVRLDETLNLYDTSIRWGAFEKIVLMQKDRSDTPDYEALKQVRVTTVNQLGSTVSEDGQECNRRVEISYYLADENIVKTLEDRQTWRYETEREVWLLDGGIPDFK